jgi:hypothetical protein
MVTEVTIQLCNRPNCSSSAEERKCANCTDWLWFGYTSAPHGHFTLLIMLGAKCQT